MKTINSFQKFENMARRARVSSRGIDVNFNIVENAMKKSLFNIDLRN